MPRLTPAELRSSSWTSWSGSPTASSGATSTVTSAGTGSASRRASSPQTTSAASTFTPWPAARHFTT